MGPRGGSTSVVSSVAPPISPLAKPICAGPVEMRLRAADSLQLPTVARKNGRHRPSSRPPAEQLRYTAAETIHDLERQISSRNPSVFCSGQSRSHSAGTGPPPSSPISPSLRSVFLRVLGRASGHRESEAHLVRRLRDWRRQRPRVSQHCSLQAGYGKIGVEQPLPTRRERGGAGSLTQPILRRAPLRSGCGVPKRRNKKSAHLSAGDHECLPGCGRAPSSHTRRPRVASSRSLLASARQDTTGSPRYYTAWRSVGYPSGAHQWENNDFSRSSILRRHSSMSGSRSSSYTMRLRRMGSGDAVIYDEFRRHRTVAPRRDDHTSSRRYLNLRRGFKFPPLPPPPPPPPPLPPPPPPRAALA